MYISVNGVWGAGVTTLISNLKERWDCHSFEVDIVMAPYSQLDMEYFYNGCGLFRLLHGTGYAFEMFVDADRVIFDQLLYRFYTLRNRMLVRLLLDFFCDVYSDRLSQTSHFWLKLDSRECRFRRAQHEVGDFMDVTVGPADEDAVLDAEMDVFLKLLSDRVPNFYVLDSSVSKDELVCNVLDIVGS